MHIQEVRKYESPEGDLATFIVVQAQNELYVFAVTEYKDGSPVAYGHMSDKDFADHVTWLMGQEGWKPVEDIAPTGKIDDPLGPTF